MRKEAYKTIRKICGGYLIEVGMGASQPFNGGKAVCDYNIARLPGEEAEDFWDPERLSSVWEAIEPNDTGLIHLDIRLYPTRGCGGPDYKDIYVVGDKVFDGELPAPFDNPVARMVYLATA